MGGDPAAPPHPQERPVWERLTCLYGGARIPGPRPDPSTILLPLVVAVPPDGHLADSLPTRILSPYTLQVYHVTSREAMPGTWFSSCAPTEGVCHLPRTQCSLGVSELYLHARPHMRLDAAQETKAQRGRGSAHPQTLSLSIPPLWPQITYKDSNGDGGGSREHDCIILPP